MNEILNNKVVRKTFHFLPEWKGESILDTYGNKRVLVKNGKPVFAEIFALEEFIELGFKGVWVDSFRKKFRIDIPETNRVLELPVSISERLFEINKDRKLRGTWDLLLWRKEEIKFVELKRKGKDKIRNTQIEFFERALQIGFNVEDFEIYEWDLKNEN